MLVGGMALAAAGLAACTTGGRVNGRAEGRAPRVGRDPVPAVHLIENHSSALLLWRRAGVRNRILVHLDGHADLDWLPDETIARIAAASPDELSGLERHPYATDGKTLRGYGVGNWIYPAARLGMVRHLVWVVPDGTLPNRDAAIELTRETLLTKIQMVTVEEARSLSVDGRVIHGVLLGLPVTVCELRDLEAIREPVLLDMDLDYFVTRSALTSETSETPRIGPEAVLEALAFRGLRADFATLSLSTLGGFLPPECRWLGRALQRMLVAPGRTATGAEGERRAAEEELASGRGDRAATILRRLVGQDGEDPTLWYSLATALGVIGRDAEAAEARARAVALDPVLAHDELYRADRCWTGRRYADGVAGYRRYLRHAPSSPFAAYARRREADCLMRLARDDEAIAAFRAALRAAPDDGDSHFELGALLTSRGRIDEATRELETARRLLPDRASCALALGTAYAIAGRADEAMPQLEFAVDRQPCLGRARSSLAALLYRLGRYDEAAAHLEVAMELRPSPDPPTRELAAALTRRGVPLVRVSARP
ncbi:MAG: tetratricopeptide repeat protein [Acidobacteriia bacterium]|nr:tetratricopeptide repeat protein [Terriglobia bacterium]